MTDIVERLRYTASVGIPDFTNSKLLEEAADEIERLETLVQGLMRNIDADTADMVPRAHQRPPERG